MDEKQAKARIQSISKTIAEYYRCDPDYLSIRHALFTRLEQLDIFTPEQEGLVSKSVQDYRESSTKYNDAYNALPIIFNLNRFENELIDLREEHPVIYEECFKEALEKKKDYLEARALLLPLMKSERDHPEQIKQLRKENAQLFYQLPMVMLFEASLMKEIPYKYIFEQFLESLVFDYEKKLFVLECYQLNTEVKPLNLLAYPQQKLKFPQSSQCLETVLLGLDAADPMTRLYFLGEPGQTSVFSQALRNQDIHHLDWIMTKAPAALHGEIHQQLNEVFSFKQKLKYRSTLQHTGTILHVLNFGDWNSRFREQLLNKINEWFEKFPHLKQRLLSVRDDEGKTVFYYLGNSNWATTIFLSLQDSSTLSKFQSYLLAWAESVSPEFVGEMLLKKDKNSKSPIEKILSCSSPMLKKAILGMLKRLDLVKEISLDLWGSMLRIAVKHSDGVFNAVMKLLCQGTSLINEVLQAYPEIFSDIVQRERCRVNNLDSLLKTCQHWTDETFFQIINFHYLPKDVDEPDFITLLVNCFEQAVKRDYEQAKADRNEENSGTLKVDFSRSLHLLYTGGNGSFGLQNGIIQNFRASQTKCVPLIDAILERLQNLEMKEDIRKALCVQLFDYDAKTIDCVQLLPIMITYQASLSNYREHGPIVANLLNMCFYKGSDAYKYLTRPCKDNCPSLLIHALKLHWEFEHLTNPEEDRIFQKSYYTHCILPILAWAQGAMGPSSKLYEKFWNLGWKNTDYMKSGWFKYWCPTRAIDYAAYTPYEEAMKGMAPKKEIQGERCSEVTTNINNIDDDHTRWNKKCRG